MTTANGAAITPKVHLMDNRASSRHKNLDKLGRLLRAAGLRDVVSKGDLVAVKLTFGERGSTGFIHPVYVAKVVEEIKRAGGRPILTDANTLYSGARSNAYDSLTTALRNGFSYATVGAPIVILDGLVGHDYREVAISGTIFERVKIGTAILDADSLVSLAHFKGHMLGGFGGQIKNLGMGCAPRSGKQMMHSDFRPDIHLSLCKGCRMCKTWCPEGAISLVEAASLEAAGERCKETIGARLVAQVDLEKCVGCGECVATCPEGAIKVSWDSAAERVQQKMAELALGALEAKRERFLGVSFILNVTPDCDCVPWSDASIVPDVGVAAGRDPVALDQACYELVNAQAGIRTSALGDQGVSTPDKFAFLHKVDPTAQLKHGELIGLGLRSYELVTA